MGIRVLLRDGHGRAFGATQVADLNPAWVAFDAMVFDGSVARASESTDPTSRSLV